jgi:hypothetical protein
MHNLRTYEDLRLNEASDTKSESFETFADNRLSGASKIADNAKEKGGDAMLTYHHFNVKLPIYQKSAKGKFSPEQGIETLNSLIDELNQSVGKSVKISQVEFQKLVGLIEVWGELLIKYQEKKGTDE